MKIIVENLSKSFENNKVIDNFNYTFESGKIYCIYGRSGCGKSTLLNILGTLLKQDSGKIQYIPNDNLIKYQGKFFDRKIRRDYMSFIFQDFQLLEDKSVKYNLMLSLMETSHSKKNKSDAIKHELELVNLSGFEDKLVRNLSGGEKQRVAFARAAIKKSEVILADEPTGNLDNITRDEIIQLFIDLNKRGKTIIIVTHDDELKNFADNIIYLKQKIHT